MFSQPRTRCAERHLDGWLGQRIPGFDMDAFMKTVAEREGEFQHTSLSHPRPIPSFLCQNTYTGVKVLWRVSATTRVGRYGCKTVDPSLCEEVMTPPAVSNITGVHSK